MSIKAELPSENTKDEKEMGGLGGLWPTDSDDGKLEPWPEVEVAWGASGPV